MKIQQPAIVIEPLNGYRLKELLPNNLGEYTIKLGEIEKKFPHQLSGGMRQRVSLIRSFLLERPILLLDEPFGSLDSITREDLQDWLIDILKILKLSVIFVTHDINEAIKISNRIIILGVNPGRIIKEIKVNVNNDNEKLSLYKEIKSNLGALND